MKTTRCVVVITVAILVLDVGLLPTMSMVIEQPTLVGTTTGRQVWEKPGCHKVGHTRRVRIPDCVEFTLTTNACRGFCESWSIPSTTEAVTKNPLQLITSVGQCCNIMETEDVSVRVMCVDGPRDLIFKSARSCSCFHCKKD